MNSSELRRGRNDLRILLAVHTPLSLGLRVPPDTPEDGADVRHEPQGVQHRQQLQERRVGGVAEPGLDRNRVVWIQSVGPGRVVEDEHAGEVCGDGGQVLGVCPEVRGAVLPVVTSVEHLLASVQLVRHALAVDLHAGGEHDQLEPLRHHGEEVIHMRSLVNQKSDWMIVNGDSKYEVRREAGVLAGPEQARVAGVDQGLVQVKHQHLPPDQAEAVTGEGGEGREVIPDGIVLLHHSHLFFEDIKEQIPDSCTDD